MRLSKLISKSLKVKYLDDFSINQFSEESRIIARKIIKYGVGFNENSPDFYEIDLNIDEDNSFLLVLPIKVIYKLKRRFYNHTDEEKADILATIFLNTRDLFKFILQQDKESLFRVHNVITQSIKHKLDFKFIVKHKEDNFLNRENIVIASIMDKEKLPFIEEGTRLYIPDYYFSQFGEIGKDKKKSILKNIDRVNRLSPVFDNRNSKEDIIKSFEKIKKLVKIFEMQSEKEKEVVLI